ncbi:MAG: DUF1080 domain-containing protein [Verrucomicrobia bacterium]|nr:DUF1080 domain-containing protein [Verrucomicrobiota bacterium]
MRKISVFICMTLCVASLTNISGAETKFEKAPQLDADGWRSMFDGEDLEGWKITKFGGQGPVSVEDGKITLGMGAMATGITWTNDLPRLNYEIALEAMRVDGNDFFCGLTFPVGDSYCSFIVGGWGGGVVGLSCLDSQDASQNETTTIRGFKKKQWYLIRVRVLADRIQCWIDDEKVVDVDTTGKVITIRPEVRLSRPLGIASWITEAALRNIQIRPIDVKAQGFIPLFNSKNLDGWNGDTNIFRIENGAIVGGSMDSPIEQNEFLCTDEKYADFELRLKSKLKGEKSNAGIQIRSERVPYHNEVVGYQVDMGPDCWGSLYDESRRRRYLVEAPADIVDSVYKPGEWNEFLIRCKGDNIKVWLNGAQTVDYTEDESGIKKTGVIGLQIHSGPPGEAWYKDIEIKTLR